MARWVRLFNGLQVIGSRDTSVRSRTSLASDETTMLYDELSHGKRRKVTEYGDLEVIEISHSRSASLLIV